MLLATAPLPDAAACCRLPLAACPLLLTATTCCYLPLPVTTACNRSPLPATAACCRLLPLLACCLLPLLFGATLLLLLVATCHCYLMLPATARQCCLLPSTTAFACCCCFCRCLSLTVGVAVRCSPLLMGIFQKDTTDACASSRARWTPRTMTTTRRDKKDITDNNNVDTKNKTDKQFPDTIGHEAWGGKLDGLEAIAIWVTCCATWGGKLRGFAAIAIGLHAARPANRSQFHSFLESDVEPFVRLQPPRPSGGPVGERVEHQTGAVEASALLRGKHPGHTRWWQ